MKPNADTIYLCDNGAAYCGDHLGMTAKATGRDVSGQRIYAVTPEDAATAGYVIACERCGKRARLVYVA